MFERAVNISLEREGVLSDHKEDKGGLTKYGISKSAHPHLDIACITKEEAIAIYRASYWTVNRCDEMPWWAAVLTFDAAVHSGPERAARWLQNAVGTLVDGKVGPKTLAASWATRPERGIEEFNTIRMLYLTELGNWGTFRKGWTRRIIGLTLEAINPNPINSAGEINPNPVKPVAARRRK